MNVVSVIAAIFISIDIDDAIAARDATVDLVHRIRCFYKGTRLTGEVEEYRYLRDGATEKATLLRVSGTKTSAEETLWSDREIRSFSIGDLSPKSTLLEHFRRGDARVLPRGGEGDDGSGFRGLRNLHIDCGVWHGRITYLRDLKRIAKDVRWRGKDQSTGLWVLSMSLVPDPRLGGAPVETEFHLDPAHGFMIAKRNGRGKVRGSADAASWKKDSLLDFVGESTVTKFQTFANGVYWPTHAVSTITFGKAAPVTFEFEFKDVEVNKPIPTTDLSLTFPDDLLVMRLPSKNGRVPLEIYRNGELVRAIDGFEEWKEFAESLKRQDEAAAARRWWLMTGAAGTMLVAGLYFARQWWKSRE